MSANLLILKHIYNGWVGGGDETNTPVPPHNLCFIITLLNISLSLCYFNKQDWCSDNKLGGQGCSSVLLLSVVGYRTDPFHALNGLFFYSN